MIIQKKSFSIHKVAVLGSGVMGLGITAHLANAGISNYLFSRKPNKLSKPEADRLLIEKINQFKKSKPFPFFDSAAVDLINPANYDDDLDKLSEADWVIETISEKLEDKKAIFKKILPHLRRDAIISSNTSGLPIASIAEALPKKWHKNFLGTHFFNPVRYIKLLEIVKTSETEPSIVQVVKEFSEKILGRRVVYPKDRPSFIASRIGGLSLTSSLNFLPSKDFGVEEVDTLTGSLIGRSKSATFRTIDLIGLDTAMQIAINNLKNLKKDPYREFYLPRPYTQEMLKRGLIGEKSGQGFYKKIKNPKGETSEIQVLDVKTMRYRSQREVNFPSLKQAKKLESLTDRLRLLVFAKDRAGKFLWKNFSDTLHYAAWLIPEISDDIVSVDNALKWGFGWELGPFEIWDVLGVEKLAKRMEKDGKEIPPLVKKLLASGKKTFYEKKSGKKFCFDLGAKRYKSIDTKPEYVSLAEIKEDKKKIVDSNSGASLIDIGDGVLCLEFHTKMNTINPEIIEMIQKAVNLVERSWRGLVIHNEAPNFSAGFDLNLILAEAQKAKKNFHRVEKALKDFQDTNQLLRFSKKPVVAAVHGLTLGGGFEIALAADQIVAAAESYIGLPELGVGLVPGGGGCKEMVRRIHAAVPESEPDGLFSALLKIIETIGAAKISTSAKEAAELGYLSPADKIVMNSDRLLFEAKNTVLSMDQAGYTPSKYADNIRVLGEQGMALMEVGPINFVEGGYATKYDYFIAKKIIKILCGGPLKGIDRVDEQYLLDLEKEAFLSLLKEKNSIARIKHILKTNKPLRN
ncbi:MAG: enoyl-CoA hydratase/isomerase family protein [Candidatus Peribacteraceae bacterium]|nr:enoyl-CoA hydratase/isomerase family protein [Candidatus Peribacteraceae bacterium]